MAGRRLRALGFSSMTAASARRVSAARGSLARASLASALILRPAAPRQVLNTMLVAGWLIAVAAILAVGIVAAIRWPTAAASLAFRAGYAAGVAWARLRSFGTWLLYGVKRMIE